LRRPSGFDLRRRPDLRFRPSTPLGFRPSAQVVWQYFDEEPRSIGNRCVCSCVYTGSCPSPQTETIHVRLRVPPGASRRRGNLSIAATEAIAATAAEADILSIFCCCLHLTTAFTSKRHHPHHQSLHPPVSQQHSQASATTSRRQQAQHEQGQQQQDRPQTITRFQPTASEFREHLD
jgi:hypothetical protein